MNKSSLLKGRLFPRQFSELSAVSLAYFIFHPGQVFLWICEFVLKLLANCLCYAKHFEQKPYYPVLSLWRNDNWDTFIQPCHSMEHIISIVKKGTKLTLFPFVHVGNTRSHLHNYIWLQGNLWMLLTFSFCLLIVFRHRPGLLRCYWFLVLLDHKLTQHNCLKLWPRFDYFECFCLHIF